MKIIQLGRGEGKTAQLIDWLMDGKPSPTGIPYTWDRALMVANEDRAESVREEIHRRLGGQPDWSWEESLSNAEYTAQPWVRFRVLSRQVVTPFVVRSGRWHPVPPLLLAIDELDDVLRVLFSANVELATLTPER